MVEIVEEPIQFEWDQGNRNKTIKHGVTTKEAEECFLDQQKVVFDDWRHSTTEKRFTLLGKTKNGRLLNITHTIRSNRIRVITARDINKREVYLYEKAA